MAPVMSVTDRRRTGRSESRPWVGRGPELSEQTVAHIAGALEASHSAGTRRAFASDWAPLPRMVRQEPVPDGRSAGDRVRQLLAAPDRA
ncbi:hypothetical protein CA951_32145 [Rhodococcus sp. NCIMB 12038]|nr:hypothetical protein CA951_32145 [Rhodococcus sp. NCIMB 12038]